MKPSLVLFLVTVGIWFYYFFENPRIEWWKMLLFNGIMIYGISKTIREDGKSD